MVEELDVAQYGAEPALKRIYTWGLDLAGSFSGAGGIGGLLEIQNKATLLSGDTGTYLTVFEPGANTTRNGMSQVLNTERGTPNAEHRTPQLRCSCSPTTAKPSCVTLASGAFRSC
ncbi:MAG: hypothetical protein SFY80_15980 [Verrucomicrobiota bacterium]|nr:hypothetical protein [Verrucomicrobiota bacterium]